MRHLVIILLCLLAACGPAKAGNHTPTVDLTGWPGGPTYEWHGHTIFMPDSVNKKTADGIAYVDTIVAGRIIDAVTYQITAWEQDNCVTVPPTRIAVSDFSVECDNAGNDYSGCWRGDDAIINVIGRFEDVWPVYHELCHRVFQLRSHDDPRWVQWNRRVVEIEAIMDARPYPPGVDPKNH